MILPCQYENGLYEPGVHRIGRMSLYASSWITLYNHLSTSWYWFQLCVKSLHDEYNAIFLHFLSSGSTKSQEFEIFAFERTTLKAKGCQFDNFVITGGTISCHGQHNGCWLEPDSPEISEIYMLRVNIVVEI